ncbi:MAG: glycosyltransferase [Desulfobacteraceae bacterium]|nr:glycosyltransferase [Desulfobacteraceae bacterium]
MKILFLSQRFLLPMDTGGKIRTGKILEQLSQLHEITLISNVEEPKDSPYLPNIRELCTEFVSVPWKEIKKYSFPFFVRLFFQMFSIYPVNVLNDSSAKLRVAVEKEAASGNYDVAICDFVQSALMFRDIKGIPTLLFQHNVESEISRRHVTQSDNIIMKIFWFLQWKKMLLFEKRACKSFDKVIAVSEKDRQTFEKLYSVNNVTDIPTGVDVDYFAPVPDPDIKVNSLVFCGSMDWLPNEDAVIFFVRDILGKIKQNISNITLTIAGRNPSPNLTKLIRDYPEVSLTGWVEDTRPYIAGSSLYIVPIRIGGGTRMKIYEAMAMGKSVISTSVGAEGLPVVNGENIIIEDDPTEFAKKITELLKSEEKREKIGTAACDYVRKYFAWESVAESFSSICKSAMNSSERSAEHTV